MKIDGNAVIPIGWVFAGFASIISITMMAAFWVAAVNFRLSRIEEKLDISTYRSKINSDRKGPSYANSK